MNFALSLFNLIHFLFSLSSSFQRYQFPFLFSLVIFVLFHDSLIHFPFYWWSWILLCVISASSIFYFLFGSSPFQCSQFPFLFSSMTFVLFRFSLLHFPFLVVVMNFVSSPFQSHPFSIFSPIRHENRFALLYNFIHFLLHFSPSLQPPSAAPSQSLLRFLLDFPWFPPTSSQFPPVSLGFVIITASSLICWVRPRSAEIPIDLDGILEKLLRFPCDVPRIPSRYLGRAINHLPAQCFGGLCVWVTLCASFSLP